MPIVLPLVALDVLVLVLWCIAVALAIALVLDHLSSILAGVPWIGGKLSDAVKAMASAISNAASAIEGGADHLIGAAWHALSRYVDKLFEQFVAHSRVLVHLARVVGELVYSHSGLKSFVKSVAVAAHDALKLADKLQKEYHGIEHRVRTIEREIAAGIGSDVLPRIKTLEREVANVEGKVIPAVEGAEKALANDITALGEWVRANFVSTATDAISAAVAVALAALGLGGLRCSNFTGLLSKWGCGLGRLLDDLLGLMIAGLALEAICDFLPLVEAVFGAIVGPTVHLLNEVPLGSCETMPADWSDLHVAAGPLPPPQTLGTLPS